MSNEIINFQNTQIKLKTVATGFVPQGQYTNQSARWQVSYQAPPKKSLLYAKTPEHPQYISSQVHASQITPVEIAKTITAEELTEVLSQELEQHQLQLELLSEPEA